METQVKQKRPRTPEERAAVFAKIVAIILADPGKLGSNNGKVSGKDNHCAKEIR
jgi:hypothetical protein